MIAAGHPQGFLIDGFPRNQDNFDGWNREMDTKANVQFVLFLDCDQEVCTVSSWGKEVPSSPPRGILRLGVGGVR